MKFRDKLSHIERMEAVDLLDHPTYRENYRTEIL